ncbi:hypothetical protein AB0M46_46045 [Dactylosporangium sp. NPDC051485]
MFVFAAHVGRSVTRRTRLLVAADPDSTSGKARTAAQYGIPAVHRRRSHG